MVKLVSYPRSGSHWLCYCLEYITATCIPRTYRSNKLPYKLSSRVIQFNHWGFPGISYPENTRGPRILLLRNYKECIKSHSPAATTRTHPRQKQRTGLLPPGMPEYIHNILIYEICVDPKAIIYYEDLMLNPSAELEKIIKWLEPIISSPGMRERFDQLILSLDDHRSMCYEGYPTDKIHSGMDLLHHSSKMACGEPAEWDEIAYANWITGSRCLNWPEQRTRSIFEKYLGRYLEK